MAATTRRTNSSQARSSRDSVPAPDRATAYAEGVTAGRIIAGPHVRAACARHLRDVAEGHERGLVWRPDAGERVHRYFRTVLRLNGGEHEGQPFVLTPWEAFVEGSLFGWYTADGYRRFRVAYIETAKGSGKSPLAAGTGMYMLHADGEARAEVYAAATKKDQAMVLFRDAVAMAQQSPHLAAHLVTSGGNPVWQLSHLPSGSFFKPISSDDGQSGPRPHCALIDEIHEHKSDTVVEMMRAGTKGRRQALIFMITNSGSDRQSVCYTLHEYGMKVAGGTLQDDSFFAYICAIDEGENPITDPPDPALGYPRSWAKTNPSLGTTIQPKYLEEQVREARGMPSKESKVRRLNFCEWVDAVDPWIDGDLWSACEVDELPVEDGAPTFLALDLAETRDLVAATKVTLLADGRLTAEMKFWTPEETLEERSRTDRVPYDVWVRAGFVTAVPGRSIDFRVVARDMEPWMRSSGGLAFDQWRIGAFQQAMDDMGIDSWIWDPPKVESGSGIRLVRHAQGFMGGKVSLDAKGAPLPRTTLWMPQSITDLETAVIKGQLLVKRNPCLTYNSASAVLERDAAGNAKWEKRKSTGRIDGIVTLSMGVGLARTPLPVKPSYKITVVGVKR